MRVGSDNNPYSKPRQDRKVATVKNGELVVRKPDRSRSLFDSLLLPANLSHDRLFLTWLLYQ